MSFQLIGAGSDLSSTQTQMNKNILELKNNETTTVFKDDTGTRRVLLGKGADGFYGLKVSKPGVDVFTATDDEISFTSDLVALKLLDKGTVTMTKAASATLGTATITYDTSEIGSVVPVFFGLSLLYGPLNFCITQTTGADSGKVRLATEVDMSAGTIDIYYRTPDWAANTLYTGEVTDTILWYIGYESAQF